MGDFMNLFIKKILVPTIIFILLFVLIAFLTTNKPVSKMQNNYMLRSYKNTIALYNNGNIVKIYDNIVLNTLPQHDIQNFNSGIPVTSQTAAEAYLEDFE